MQKLSTQSYKGSRDFFPEDMEVRNYIFDVFRDVCLSYGFQEYDGPFIEPFELYAAKTGQEIVNEQLYSFTDRGDRKVAIRPEMTPTLARMVAQKQKELIKPIRWFSIPNLWRYEKPQKGRLREHYQLNVDVFGVDAVTADVEIVSIIVDILLNFGADDSMFKIKVGNRKLIEEFFEKIAVNEETRSPIMKLIDRKLKIGDEEFVAQLEELQLSKNQIEEINNIFNNSTEFLNQMKASGSKGAAEVLLFLELLENVEKGKYVEYSPTIIRGLDYYTGNVFEVFDLFPENNRAIAGGGRYNDLISIFSNESLPGIGFGMGDVTARNFLENWDLLPDFRSNVDFLVTVWPSDDFQNYAVSSQIADMLRVLGMNTICWAEIDTKIDKQLKYADKNKVPFAIIIGEEELQNETVTIKDMNKNSQKTVSVEKLEAEIQKLI